MRQSDTIVFTTCYNERENIGPMIDQIAANVPTADILVVDDNSPDGTWEIIEEKQRIYPQLRAVKRPGKLGIGSAHKYALFYAMREGYKKVVTMDADFSHNPKLIPSLLSAHGDNVFVTGSRYCKGGTSDYSGYRDVVSRFGNKLARLVLGVQIHELTTYFRVFDVESLKRLPLRLVAASGYSYGVELVYHLRKAGVELREVPIHFTDRTHGASKIPRLQIFKSAFDLFLLGLRRFNILRDLRADEFVDDVCASCGDRVLAMKHFGSRSTVSGADRDSAEYRCTAVGAQDYPPVYTCLACGLEQVPASLVPAGLESLYEDVVDTTYVANRHVREKTYRRSFDQILPYLPERPGTLLEVGAYCGLFLKEAERRGWQGEGVEPSNWASRYARETVGMRVHQGFLDEVSDRLAPRYDVVVSWDVLEHVRDPLSYLRRCGSYLDKGGILAISTLDVDTWAPRLLGTRWPWLMNMHLFYFGTGPLKTLLRSAGFELVAAEPYVHYASARHIYNGGLRVLPSFLRKPFSYLGGLVPKPLTVPVAFGDIKLYVARKIDDGSCEAVQLRLASVAK
jgi:hypothetical protein